MQGTYTYKDITITLDGAGKGTYNNGTEYEFTYSGEGESKAVSDFAAWNSGSNTIKVQGNGDILLDIDDEYGENHFSATFAKQA